MIPKHYRIHVVLAFAALLMIVVPMLSKRPDPEQEKHAAAAAERFLGLVDAGEYGRSWEVSSGLLKEKVGREEWSAQLAEIRETGGAVARRELKEARYTPKAQDAPEGDYIVLEYGTVFEKQGEQAEHVIATREEDGEWRVAGYFIR